MSLWHDLCRHSIVCSLKNNGSQPMLCLRENFELIKLVKTVGKFSTFPLIGNVTTVCDVGNDSSYRGNVALTDQSGD